MGTSSDFTAGTRVSIRVYVLNPGAFNYNLTYFSQYFHLGDVRKPLKVNLNWCG